MFGPALVGIGCAVMLTYHWEGLAIAIFGAAVWWQAREDERDQAEQDNQVDDDVDDDDDDRYV